MPADKKPPAKTDEDEEVLFEGELTWTHDPVPASPEILQRTPRQDEPAKKEHVPPPSEGSIELSELSEGGGEIFSVDDQPDGRDRQAETASELREAEAAPEISDAQLDEASAAFESDTPAQKPAEPAAEADSGTAAAQSGIHGRTLQPLNGFSKAKAAGQPSRLRPQGAGRVSGSAAPAGRAAAGSTAVAGEFALPADPNAGRPRHIKAILSAVAVVAVLSLAGIAAYVFMVLPNRPDAILAQALAATLEQQSVQFKLSANEQGADKQPIMDMQAGGGISQVGSYDATVQLKNQSTPQPLNLNVRSIDGLTTFVQGTNLAVNQPYLTKLGVPATAGVPGGPLAALEGKWIAGGSDIRADVIRVLGFENLPASPGLSADDKRKVAGLYAKYPFLSIRQTLEDTPVAGVDSHHFLLAVNKVQLTAFAIALKDQVKPLGVTQVQVDAANKLDTAQLKLEVWVDKRTKLLSQVALAKPKPGATLSWQLSLSEYNKALALQQPTPDTDAIGAMRLLAGPGAGEAEGQALLQKIAGNYSAAGR